MSGYELKLFRRDQAEAAQRDGWTPAHPDSLTDQRETHILMRRFAVAKKNQESG